MLNEVKFIVKDKTKLYNKIRLREILKGTKVMSVYKRIYNIIISKK